MSMVCHSIELTSCRGRLIRLDSVTKKSRLSHPRKPVKPPKSCSKTIRQYSRKAAKRCQQSNWRNSMRCETPGRLRAMTCRSQFYGEQKAGSPQTGWPDTGGSRCEMWRTMANPQQPVPDPVPDPDPRVPDPGPDPDPGPPTSVPIPPPVTNWWPKWAPKPRPCMLAPGIWIMPIWRDPGFWEPQCPGNRMF